MPKASASFSRRKFRGFAIAVVAGSLLLSGGALFATDLYFHRRAERSAGLNVWGYRGALVGHKQPGELRIAMLGGSTVFGYGVYSNEAPPVVLEQHLNALPHAGVRRITVVNLGFNGEGAHSYRYTLDDFAWLDYDVVLLTDGYNDIGGDAAPNRAVFRHKSLVFRLTGYYPIMPMVLHDKAAQIRGEREQRAVFRPPGVVARASAQAIEAMSNVTSVLERQIARGSAQAPHDADAGALGCAAPWISYCESMYLAVRDGLARGKLVGIVLQPRLTAGLREPHASQQAALAGMLQRLFAGAPRVRWFDLSGAVNLEDTALSFDGMHLTPAGIECAIGVLAPQLASVLFGPEATGQ